MANENETIIKKPGLAWFCGILFLFFLIKVIANDVSGYKYYGNIWDYLNFYIVYLIYKGNLV